MKKPLYHFIASISFGVVFILGGSNSLFAQGAGYFNHQYLQPILINVGATGFQGDHQLLADYKHSYSDFPGAPRTFTALYQGSFADNLGVGFQLMTDQVGVGQTSYGQLNFAYKLDLNDVKLGIGISAGLETFKIKDIRDDQLIDPTDVLLNEALDGYMLFDGSVGLYGEVKEKLFFGISFPDLIKERMTNISGNINVPDLNTFSYAFLLGYRFDVENYDFVVEPSVTIKDLRYSPFLIDLNLKLSFLDEQLVGGIGYTLGDNSRASLLLGTRINKLRIYYSYDVSLGDFQDYNNGSHELMLVYRIPKKSTASAATPGTELE